MIRITRRAYVGGGGPKDDYPYRNGPMRSSPPGPADMVVPSGSVGGPGRPMQQGAVMMVYGLCKDRMNAEKLFNLFCLYGNVVRVSCGFRQFQKINEGDETRVSQIADGFLLIRLMNFLFFFIPPRLPGEIPQVEGRLCNGADGRCVIG